MGFRGGRPEIGGFVTDDNESDRFRELMVRWYQYGVFTPIFRTHGHRPNNEAWTIGGDSYRHIRAAMLLRERLTSVCNGANEAGHRPWFATNATGLFLILPMIHGFADIEDQFLFGSDLLVAPITTYGARRRSVYLPAGIGWTDAWTGQKWVGGEVIEAKAPIEHIPVYVRGANAELVSIFSPARL